MSFFDNDYLIIHSKCFKSSCETFFVVFELIFLIKHHFLSLANFTEYCLIVSTDRVRSALHRLPAQ